MSGLRGGLIGCGFFATNHLNAWQVVRGAEIVAVCDVDAARARKYAEDWKIGASYSDASRMLKSEQLDFVDVVTQVSSHRELIELAAEFGVHVICQKPMAPSMSDACEAVQKCLDHGVRLMVHENFRWQHAMRVVKEALPRIGDLAFGRITWRTGWDIYTNQPYLAREPQLVVADMGVHILDLARFFMGEANQLYCQTQRVNTRVLGEDQATVMLKMQSGATCVAEMSYYSKLDRELFPQTLVHFEGTLGSVTLHPDFEVAVTVDSAVEWIDARAPEHPWSAPMFAAVQDSVVGIQQHWADCLHRGRDPETSGADNLRTLELVYGAYESAQTGLPYRTFNR